MNRRMPYLLLMTMMVLSFVTGGCSSTSTIAGEQDGPSTGKEGAGSASVEEVVEKQVMTSPGVATYFTREGDHPEEAIVQLIEEAQSTLDIAIYSINLEPIVDAMIEAANRGVNVRLITDAAHAKEKGKQAKAIQNLRSAGIPVKVNAHDGKMHLKMMIADGKTVEVGSFNYLQSAAEENDDVAVIIQDAAAAASFAAAFLNMWNDDQAFEDYGS